MKLSTNLAPGASPSPNTQERIARMGDAAKSYGAPCPTSLRNAYARLSARAAQARGRGEWALAAKVAAQMAALDPVLPSPRRR